MSCTGCVQKILEQNAETISVYESAKAEAQRTGHWYAVYTDTTGTKRFIRADIAAAEGMPVERYATP